MTVCSTGPCWTASTYNGTNFQAQSAAYFNDLYIIGGQNLLNGNSEVQYSSDGIDWTRVSLSGTGGGGVKTFASGNGLLIGMVNFDKHIVSTDGINWSVVAHWPPVSAETGFAFGDGNFVVTVNAADRFAFSPDGEPGSWNFTICAPGSFGYMLNSRIYGNGLFVTTGNDGFSYTSDVATPVTVVPTPGSGGAPTEIAYGNGVFVANSTISRNIYRSTNGTSWTLLTDALPLTPGLAPWRGIIHSQDYFICATADSNMLAISADGITWTLTTSEHWFDSAFNVGFPILATDGSGNYLAANTPNNIAQIGVCPCPIPVIYKDCWASLSNITVKNINIYAVPSPPPPPPPPAYRYRIDFSSWAPLVPGTSSVNLNIMPNSWNIYTVTHSPDGTVRFYVNAVEVPSVPGPFQELTGYWPGQQYLGRADNYWLGRIGYWQIYNTALTQQQITQNFDATKNRFGFTGGSGSIITDNMVLYVDANNGTTPVIGNTTLTGNVPIVDNNYFQLDGSTGFTIDNSQLYNISWSSGKTIMVAAWFDDGVRPDAPWPSYGWYAMLGAPGADGLRDRIVNVYLKVLPL